jgi:RsmE family RNA methyltransferase
VNLILFEADEIGRPLPLTDRRAIHLLRVLRRSPGDAFDAGIVDGPLGKGRIEAVTAGALTLRFAARAQPPPCDEIHLVIALPRPQTARKILNEAGSLGVASLRFFPAEKGEAGYAASTLWSSGEWRRHLLEGAAHAFDTRLPEVAHDRGLDASCSALSQGGARIALDNYEASGPLRANRGARPIALAFGPERGWSASERARLRDHGFELAHLGARVLRTETAVVAALALVKAAS